MTSQRGEELELENGSLKEGDEEKYLIETWITSLEGRQIEDGFFLEPDIYELRREYFVSLKRLGYVKIKTQINDHAEVEAIQIIPTDKTRRLFTQVVCKKESYEVEIIAEI